MAVQTQARHASNGQAKDVPQGETEELPLNKAVQHMLEECRMILPGIQALFGFQLVAVFNSSFDEKLAPAEQQLHVVAIAFVAVAVALIMTPAVFHRQTSPREVTAAFLSLSTRLLLWSMVPLALGICIDFALIARMVLGQGIGVTLAAIIAGVFAVLWLALPRVTALQRLFLIGCDYHHARGH
ncbi:MAG: DUF6328 family protein [Gemmataceae bacterium]